MNHLPRPRAVLILIILLLVFGLPTSAEAQGIVYGDTVPAGTTLDHDIVLIGQEVRIDGTINGNVFVLGNQVNIDGNVNGSLVLVGQNVAIAGEISGGTYALALTVELATGAQLGRDLYVLTVSLASGSEARIERDLFAIGLDAGLNGQVGRDLHTAIGPIQLYNGLMRLLGFEEFTLKLRFELPQPSNDSGSSRETAPHTGRARAGNPRRSALESFDWGRWGISVARDWAVLVFFGLLAVWLAPKRLEQAKTALQDQPWKAGTVGLLVLVIAINLFAVGLLVAALIFSLGLALNYLQLWQLSIAFWLLAYAALAILLTLLWLFIVYGTKIIFAYALFTWLIGKLGSTRWVQVLALLVGLLIYVLLRSIPTVGWVFGVLVSAYGLGIAWAMVRRPKREPTKKPVPKSKKG